VSRFSPEGSNTRPAQASHAEEQPIPVSLRTVVALMLLVLGVGLTATGVALWVCPAAGVATLGADLTVLGLMIGKQ